MNAPEPLASTVLSAPVPLTLTIVRVTTPSSVRPTFGVFRRSDGTPFAVTLERPWKNNERMVSCIPVGTYTCKRVQSPKFGDTFEVTGVPGRSAILFHKGNLSDDSHGCILVAENFAHVKAEDGIAGSAEGFAEFKQVTAGVDTFTLVVQ